MSGIPSYYTINTSTYEDWDPPTPPSDILTENHGETFSGHISRDSLTANNNSDPSSQSGRLREAIEARTGVSLIDMLIEETSAASSTPPTSKNNRAGTGDTLPSRSCPMTDRPATEGSSHLTRRPLQTTPDHQMGPTDAEDDESPGINALQDIRSTPRRRPSQVHHRVLEAAGQSNVELDAGAWEGNILDGHYAKSSSNASESDRPKPPREASTGPEPSLHAEHQGGGRPWDDGDSDLDYVSSQSSISDTLWENLPLSMTTLGKPGCVRATSIDLGTWRDNDELEKEDEDDSDFRGEIAYDASDASDALPYDRTSDASARASRLTSPEAADEAVDRADNVAADGIGDAADDGVDGGVADYQDDAPDTPSSSKAGQSRTSAGWSGRRRKRKAISQSYFDKRRKARKTG